MPRDVPHNVEELLECQSELVKTLLGDAPIFREMFTAMTDAAQTYRMLRLKSLVRETDINCAFPGSYDKGFSECLTFLTDLTGKDE